MLFEGISSVGVLLGGIGGLLVGFAAVAAFLTAKPGIQAYVRRQEACAEVAKLQLQRDRERSQTPSQRGRRAT